MTGELELNRASGGNFDSDHPHLLNNFVEERKSPELEQPEMLSSQASSARSQSGKPGNIEELFKCFICFSDL